MGHLSEERADRYLDGTLAGSYGHESAGSLKRSALRACERDGLTLDQWIDRTYQGPTREFMRKLWLRDGSEQP